MKTQKQKREQQIYTPIQKFKQITTNNVIKYKPIYSSRSQTVHRITVENTHLPYKLQKHQKSTTIRTIKSKNMSQIQILSALSNSIKAIQYHKLNSQINMIKKQCRKVLKENSRENRMRLVDILQELHPFFMKIHRNIAQALIILGKPALYYKGETIHATQTQTQTLDKSNKNARSKQDIGFIIYGKLQLINDKVFYSHTIKDFGTIFQSKFIGRKDKIQYHGNALADTLIFWISKQSYYVIRKECFLTLDLKYMFGEFQNMLKLSMVQKKLGPPLVSAK